MGRHAPGGVALACAHFADDDPLTGAQARQDLGIHLVVQADLDPAQADPASVVDHPDLIPCRAMAGITSASLSRATTR